MQSITNDCNHVFAYDTNLNGISLGSPTRLITQHILFNLYNDMHCGALP